MIVASLALHKRPPNFSKLPITIIYKGTATTVVTISLVVAVVVNFVFFTFVISIVGGEFYSPFLIIPIVLFIIAIGIFFVFGRTVYKIDEHVVRARYTGLFNKETDFKEPIQAYRAVEGDRHFDGDGNVLCYQVSLDHPDSTRRIIFFETLDMSQLIEVGEQAANALHLPLVYKRN